MSFFRLTGILASLFALANLPSLRAAEVAEDEAEYVRKGVVSINVTYQYPDYREPWKTAGGSRGDGSGFIVKGQRIMTNAHVVSNATSIKVRRESEPRLYQAKVKFVAHDCDLAILEVADKKFFADSHALEFGGIPKLNSTVAAYGFPIGGRRMSVTRGIVSRIEFHPYSHSGVQQHLSIQVDAAINPGNSGGPIVQNGKVVGIAFQAFRSGGVQNTGYMIPTPVIGRMLKDIEDGRYDGYMELAVDHTNLLNPAYRKYLGLPNDNRGALVTEVMPKGSADGVIKAGDVLLKIDSFPIDSTGNIRLDRETVQLEEIVERRFYGDKVAFELLRQGKPMKVEVALKGAEQYEIYAWKYDLKPRFVLFAGLLFQPLSRNLISAHKISNPNVMHFYNVYVKDRLYLKRPELIILSEVLPDPINTSFKAYRHMLVEEINGVKIKRLKDVAAAFKKAVSYHVIKLGQHGRPIVIEAAKVHAARQRIIRGYAVHEQQFLGD